MKKILFISGSVGLGHVTRDLGIAHELRKFVPGLKIFWLAAHPATEALREKGEILIDESERWACFSLACEKATRSFRLNLPGYAVRLYRGWKRNTRLYKKIIERYRFDLVVGDESYEVFFSMRKHFSRLGVPFIMMYDFVGMERMTAGPLERIGVFLLNKRWATDYRTFEQNPGRVLFCGVPEDVPDRPFGPGLINRRTHALSHYRFTGYVLPFSRERIDGENIKARLGYADHTLLICSAGGTGVGGDLIRLCISAYPLIKRTIADLRMVAVCGPRLLIDDIEIPEGVVLLGYVPDLYLYYAACDLAVVQGGASSTMELTALRKQFVYFPLGGHFEQAVYVKERQKRYGAGTAMTFSSTTSGQLADTVLSKIGKPVRYTVVPTNGAHRAAQEIARFLHE